MGAECQWRISYYIIDYSKKYMKLILLSSSGGTMGENVSEDSTDTLWCVRICNS